MKILSSGNTNWTAVVKCKACGAAMEIERNDLQVVNTAVGYAGETWEPEIRVKCGVCKTPITVTKKVPYGIRSEMEDAYRRRHGI